MNASKPSEHPPNEREKMSKRLGGNIGFNDKNSSWHFIVFPDGSSIGSNIMSGKNRCCSQGRGETAVQWAYRCTALLLFRCTIFVLVRGKEEISKASNFAHLNLRDHA